MSKKKEIPAEMRAECDAAKALFIAHKNSLGLTQAKLAEIAEISPAAVAMYLNGTNALNAKFATVLSRLTGEPVERFSPRLAREIADLARAAAPGNVRPAIQPNGLRPFPVISGVAAGGWGDAIQPFEPGAEDRVEYTGYQPKGMAFWLEVEGDSMHSPTDPQSVTEGSLILVDTGIEPHPGCLVVAKLDIEEKATFKKLVSDAGHLYLKPLNPAYRMIPINGNCRIIGVVKESKRKH